MAGIKRTHDLDVGPEEDDETDQSYDSGGLEDSRHNKASSVRSRAFKRQKKALSESDSDEAAESDEVQYVDSKAPLVPEPLGKNEPTQQDHPKSHDQPSQVTHQTSKKQTSRKPKEKDRKRKTGVVYLSRIPPFMKPPTVRQLLSPYGIITRLFLTPEPQAHYLARKRNHGNKKRSFLDGWVEFASKKHAKACAETINCELVGGKKGGWYHDDIWNVKYLKGFKWDDLMEGVRSEERAREERMRVEIRRETRERKAFLEGVEQSKKERGMEKKRAEKTRNLPSDISESLTTADFDLHERELRKEERSRRKKLHERRFRQNEVRNVVKGSTVDQPDEVRRVLNKIF